MNIERPILNEKQTSQTHFIKTVEDLYEILVGSLPGIKFGLAFSEASGDCLIRSVGNDPELESTAD